MRHCARLLLVAICVCHAGHAHAESPALSATPNLYGMLGLNTVPSARMDSAGTLRASASLADPYLHTSIGYQFTDRVYMGLRQTSETSSLRDAPDRALPGLDMKFKLFSETTFRPEIALGFQSAFGHKRMAAEYLAFSKRYENFDFTAGFGWGRYGTRNETANPLDWTGSYFSDKRKLDGEKPSSPKDWFTGDTGFFAGIEYATPIQGLSIKADISSDGYRAERDLGLKRPSGYSFGLSYQPVEWVDAGIALMDRNTIMARVSLKSGIETWPFRPCAPTTTPRVKNIVAEKNDVSGQLYLNSYQSTPAQLGWSWKKIATDDSERLRLEPIYFGLKAPALTVSHRDLEDVIGTHQGSAEEIWRNLTLDRKLQRSRTPWGNYIFAFKLRENFSLSEDDATIMHRTDVITTLGYQIGPYFLSEMSLRYNLFSNIDNIKLMRFPVFNPVHSNDADYIKHRLAVERAFIQGFKSFSPNWHSTASAGYLDETFAGLHGEVLYRPWGRNWAAGLDLAGVLKRDYRASMNIKLLSGLFATGHLSFYYELPNTDVTLRASLGRYLAGDNGGTLAFENYFENGSKIEAFITATNGRDYDAYGGYSNISSGLRFTLPLGSIKFIPDGSSIEVNAMPVARDTGQVLDIAHKLYDMTEPLSYRHLTQNWGDVAN